jgi:signal transduction histidine kinase
VTDFDSHTSQATPASSAEGLSPAATGISLQSLIAQHLQQEGPSTSTPPTLPPPKAIGFQSAWVSGQTQYEQSAYGKANDANAGRRLNATDTTWAAGIEHLLPTPLFRLRVTKERLVREREALEIALAQAQQLQRLQPHVDHGPSSYHSPFYQADAATQKRSTPSTSQQRIRTLQERLLNIRRHETHVDYQLRQSMPPHQQWLFTLLDGWQGAQRQFQKWQQRLTQLVSIEGWIRRLDPTRLALSQANQHLRDVEQLLSQSSETDTQSHQQTVSPETLIECITLYDRLTAEAEHLQTELTQRPSWLKRTGQKLFGLR